MYGRQSRITTQMIRPSCAAVPLFATVLAADTRLELCAGPRGGDSITFYFILLHLAYNPYAYG